MTRLRVASAAVAVTIVATASLAQERTAPAEGTARLEQVASFEHQVTGVTVSTDGRIFVNFPRWTEDAPIGASVLSLVLSYLVQVYSALRERNALALTIDLMSGGTGDAAAMLARLMPGGDADDAASELGNLVRSLAATKEAHHFYPLLFYFRFEEPRYAVSRFTFVLLDLTTLIDSGLDPQRYRTLVSSPSVSALRQGAFMLLETLDRNFSSAENHALDSGETWRSRQTYIAATRTLERAGVSVQSDGTERYIAGRGKWEPLAQRVAPSLGYTMGEIDGRYVGS